MSGPVEQKNKERTLISSSSCIQRLHRLYAYGRFNIDISIYIVYSLLICIIIALTNTYVYIIAVFSLNHTINWLINVHL